jgi:hypothetical protein
MSKCKNDKQKKKKKKKRKKRKKEIVAFGWWQKFIFETGSCNVAQAGFELITLLASASCMDYRIYTTVIWQNSIFKVFFFFLPFIKLTFC